MNASASRVNAPARLIIASRESPLAMWQAEHVRDTLAGFYKGTAVSILGMTTQGDQILDRPLSTIGGKGLFIKELEVAMAEGRADLAVHSMKDVPMVMPEGFVLAAISVRENPRDAFVSNKYAALADLPAGAVVGTSSLRREAMLRSRFPDLVIKSLRGNLGTRLRKLDEAQYDAIILAAAGLLRLGLGDRIRSFLTPEESLPAPGQGALGIEVRADRPEMAAVVGLLDDPATNACVTAERAFSRALGGSCQVPLGGYAELRAGKIWLRGFIATADGRQIVEGEITGEKTEAESLGLRLAEDVKARGGLAILASLQHCA